MVYTWQFGTVLMHSGAFVQAAAITLELALSACMIGTMLGLAFAMLGRVKNPFVAVPLRAYINIVRAVPTLVWLVWFYYCLPILTGASFDSFTTAIIALSVGGSPFFAEIIRAGIESVPKGQFDSAHVLGFSKSQAFARIVLPQAFRIALPGITNDFIALFKDSSLVSVIAMVELTKTYSILAASTLRFFELGLIVAILYFASDQVTM